MLWGAPSGGLTCGSFRASSCPSQSAVWAEQPLRSPRLCVKAILSFSTAFEFFYHLTNYRRDAILSCNARQGLAASLLFEI